MHELTLAIYYCTTEGDETGMSPVDLSSCGSEFNKLLGLMGKRGSL